MASLNHVFAKLSNWFYKNFIVFDLDQNSFMIFGMSNNITVKNNKEEKVLGITFQNKLDFLLASYEHYQKGENKAQ